MAVIDVLGGLANHTDDTHSLSVGEHGDDGDHHDDHNAHHQVMIDLEHLCMIWFGVLCCNITSKKVGISSIVLQLLLGCLLVNVGLLPEEPSEFMLTFSELAITVTMFSLGLEEDVKNFLQGIKKAWGIALIGALGPFTCGYGVTLIFYKEQKVALLAGLCMTATAVSISLVTLKGAGLATSQAATGIMTSAVLDDIGCLALIAVSIPLLTSDEGVEAVDIVLIVCKAIGFFALIAIICKFVLPERVRLNWCGYPDKFVYKPGFRHFVRYDKYQTMLWVLFTGLCFGLMAAALGFHPGIGAYMGALIMNEGYFEDHFNKEPSDDDAAAPLVLDHDSFEATLHNVDTLAMTWLGPVFFVLLGTKMVFVGNEDVVVESLGQVACLFCGMIVFQFVSASVAARYVPGGFNFVESVMIGLGMLGRAELAFVVLDIAYVQNSIINLKCFYMLMFTCFLLNIACPMLIMAWKPYYMGEKGFMGKQPQLGRMATMAVNLDHTEDSQLAELGLCQSPESQEMEHSMDPAMRKSFEKARADMSPATTLTGASGAALAQELKARLGGQQILKEMENSRIRIAPLESGRIKQQIKLQKVAKKVDPYAALINLHFPTRPVTTDQIPLRAVQEDGGDDHSATLTGASGLILANELKTKLATQMSDIAEHGPAPSLNRRPSVHTEDIVLEHAEDHNTLTGASGTILAKEFQRITHQSTMSDNNLVVVGESDRDRASSGASVGRERTDRASSNASVGEKRVDRASSGASITEIQERILETARAKDGQPEPLKLSDDEQLAEDVKPEVGQSEGVESVQAAVEARVDESAGASEGRTEVAWAKEAPM